MYFFIVNLENIESKFVPTTEYEPGHIKEKIVFKEQLTWAFIHTIFSFKPLKGLLSNERKGYKEI